MPSAAARMEIIMREKIYSILCKIMNSFILAGIIILFIGLYYWMIEAGIPYQDPTLEMQIKYAINMGIGEILLANGFIIAVCSGIVRLIFGLIRKKRN